MLSLTTTLFTQVEVKKLFLIKLNVINCILLVLLLLVSVLLLKFSSSDSFPKPRPIVLSVGTFNYNLACFLCDLSFLFPNDYSCKDTFSFVSQIKNANLSKKFLVSYNVTSLFTNIPLQETIDIKINIIFSHNPNLNITRKENFSFLLHHRLIFYFQQ